MTEAARQLTPPEPPSTEQLVQRIARGDSAAEKLLFLRHQRTVKLLALRQCRGSSTDADDVVQDVFAQVFERLRAGELNDNTLFSHYLRQAIHNRCLQYFRNSGVEQSVLPEALPDPQDPQGSPLDRMLREEGRATLLKLMRELPQERDRELLYRFYAEQQDRRRICTDLRIDPMHFRKVLSRARQRMRELIERAGLQRFDGGH